MKGSYSQWTAEQQQAARDRANRNWARVKSDPERKARARAKSRAWRQAHPESHRASNLRLVSERRLYLSNLKLESGCVDCGYRANPEALHFDHVDPAEKSMSISQMGSASRERLAIELAKCVVRCANCHAIRTCRQRRNGWRND